MSLETPTPYTEQLRAFAGGMWEAQHVHPFVRGIADGNLATEQLQHHLRQDYAFMAEYARVLALACARAPRVEWSRRFAELAHTSLSSGITARRELASQWGVTSDELEYERLTATARGYCDFLMRTAATGDFGELVAALLPHVWGRAELGLALSARIEGSPYAGWIELLSAEDRAADAEWLRTVADEVAPDLADAHRQRMLEAFLQASRHELALIDMSWELEQQA